MVAKRKRLFEKLLGEGNTVTLVCMEYEKSSADYLRLIGVALFVMKAKRNRISVLSDLRYLCSIIKLLRQLNPDVVVTYTVKPTIYTGIALRFLSLRSMHIPIITGLGFSFQDNNFFRRMLKVLVVNLYRFSLSGAKKVVQQNEADADVFVNLRIVDKQDVLVIEGDGVELPNIERSSWTGNKKIVCVARLLGEKGLREMHLALEAVKNNIPTAQVELFGGLEQSRDAISTEELDAWAAAGTVIWKGYCNDVSELLSTSDFFILPSYHEGMSTAVCEAISFGLPVIGTDISGIREMIKGNGWLVKSRSVEDLAAALNSALTCSEDEWLQMSRKSIALAKHKFNREDVMRRLSEVIRC